MPAKPNLGAQWYGRDFQSSKVNHTKPTWNSKGGPAQTTALLAGALQEVYRNPLLLKLCHVATYKD